MRLRERRGRVHGLGPRFGGSAEGGLYRVAQPCHGEAVAECQRAAGRGGRRLHAGACGACVRGQVSRAPGGLAQWTQGVGQSFEMF